MKLLRLCSYPSSLERCQWVASRLALCRLTWAIWPVGSGHSSSMAVQLQSLLEEPWLQHQQCHFNEHLINLNHREPWLGPTLFWRQRRTCISKGKGTIQGLYIYLPLPAAPGMGSGWALTRLPWLAAACEQNEHVFLGFCCKSWIKPNIFSISYCGNGTGWP
jgi:hypothetical protein